MCKVKTGASICDLQDVQNLVTGVVFRQLKEFQRDDLVSAIKQYMNGSSVKCANYEVEDIVDSTLATCICNNWLSRKQGVYIPKPLL